MPKYIASEAPFAAENALFSKKRSGSIGSFARASHATKAASRTTPTASEATICGLLQPSELPWTRPQTRPSRPPLASARPGRSSALSGPWDSSSIRASGSTARPIGTFSQKIHCHAIPSTTAPPTSGPGGDGEAGDPRPGAERDAALLGGERGREDRQRQRRHDRAADSLDGPRRDQRLHRRRQRRRGGCGREQAEPDDEHPPAPEAVTERGAGEEEDGEGERVRVHRPLELLDRRAEVGADHRQRRRDDEVVQHDHEECDRRDRERPAGLRLGLHPIQLLP